MVSVCVCVCARARTVAFHDDGDKHIEEQADGQERPHHEVQDANVRLSERDFQMSMCFFFWMLRIGVLNWGRIQFGEQRRHLQVSQ